MKLPKHPLTDEDILKCVKKLKLPYFRGVFMRDELPKRPKTKECAIVNLDVTANSGTHWVSYFKNNKSVYYFDSFGNLKPPIELVKYLKNCRIYYNHDRFQNFDTYNCGHLCLTFLYNKTTK